MIHESDSLRLVLLIDLHHPDLSEARRRLWQRRLRVVGWHEDGPRYEVDYTVNISGDQEGGKDEL